MMERQFLRTLHNSFALSTVISGFMHARRLNMHTSTFLQTFKFLLV